MQRPGDSTTQNSLHCMFLMTLPNVGSSWHHYQIALSGSAPPVSICSLPPHQGCVPYTSTYRLQILPDRNTLDQGSKEPCGYSPSLLPSKRELGWTYSKL